MGDSVVEGLEVSVQNRFTEKLGSALGSQYEVINLGVRGYNLLQEFEYFKLLGTKFSPDIVLWNITYNDLLLHSGEIKSLNILMQRMSNSPFYKEYYRAKSQIEKVMLRSCLYSYIRYIYTLYSKRDFAKMVCYKMTINEARDIVKQLKQFSQHDNFKLMFVFLPVNTSEYAYEMQVLEDVVKSEGIASLDLNAYFSGSNVEQLFLPGDPCHLSPRGHLKIAQALYESLKIAQ